MTVVKAAAVVELHEGHSRHAGAEPACRPELRNLEIDRSVANLRERGTSVSARVPRTAGEEVSAEAQ